MKCPRMSLTTASFVVLLLAVDLGVIRHVALLFAVDYGVIRHEVISAAVNDGSRLNPPMLLPAANVLAVGLYRIARQRNLRTSFAIGFQVAGWAATLACVTACLADSDGTMNRLQTLDRAVVSGLDLLLGAGKVNLLYDRIDANVLSAIAYDVVEVLTFLNLPLLIVALAGGSVARLASRRPDRR